MKPEEQIRKNLKNPVPLPSNVEQKIQDSYQKISSHEVNMKGKNRTHTIWIQLAATLCVVLGISSIFFANPAMAKDIPVIGSIFEQLIDIQSQEVTSKDKTAYQNIASHSHSTDPNNNIADNNGVTIQASNTYCDGYNLYFTLSVQLDKQKFKEPQDYIHSNINIKINDTEVIPTAEYLPKSGEQTYIGLYQISRNALKESAFPDTMTIDLHIDEIYATPSSPDLLPDSIKGNWDLQFTVKNEEDLTKNKSMLAENNGFIIADFAKSPSNLYFTLQIPQAWTTQNPAPLVTDSSGKQIAILSEHFTTMEDGSQVYHYTLEYTDDTDFTIQILDKNNPNPDGTIPVIAEIPVNFQ